MVQAGFPEKAEDMVNALYADPLAPFKPDIESYNEILEGYEEGGGGYEEEGGVYRLVLY